MILGPIAHSFKESPATPDTTITKSRALKLVVRAFATSDEQIVQQFFNRVGQKRTFARSHLRFGESQNQIDTQLAVRVLIDACVDVSDLSGFVMSLFVFTAQTSAASYGVSPVMWTGFSSAQNPTSLASSGRQDLSCH